jgi:hypothetical protein
MRLRRYTIRKTAGPSRDFRMGSKTDFLVRTGDVEGHKIAPSRPSAPLLRDGALKIVATGEKEDPASIT